MKDNRTLLADLVVDGTMRVRLGQIFERPAGPKTEQFDFDKVEGMLLGLAIGDALGITTEGMATVVCGQQRSLSQEHRSSKGLFLFSSTSL